VAGGQSWHDAGVLLPELTCHDERYQKLSGSRDIHATLACRSARVDAGSTGRHAACVDGRMMRHALWWVAFEVVVSSNAASRQ